jgi:hypothetical protein
MLMMLNTMESLTDDSVRLLQLLEDVNSFHLPNPAVTVNAFDRHSGKVNMDGILYASTTEFNPVYSMDEIKQRHGEMTVTSLLREWLSFRLKDHLPSVRDGQVLQRQTFRPSLLQTAAAKVNQLLDSSEDVESDIRTKSNFDLHQWEFFCGDEFRRSSTDEDEDDDENDAEDDDEDNADTGSVSMYDRTQSETFSHDQQIPLKPSNAWAARRFSDLTADLFADVDWENLVMIGGSAFCLAFFDSSVSVTGPRCRKLSFEFCIYGLEPIAANAKAQHIYDTMVANAQKRNTQNFDHHHELSVQKSAAGMSIRTLVPMYSRGIVYEKRKDRDFIINFNLAPTLFESLQRLPGPCAICWNGSEILCLPKCVRHLEMLTQQTPVRPPAPNHGILPFTQDGTRNARIGGPTGIQIDLLTLKTHYANDEMFDVLRYQIGLKLNTQTPARDRCKAALFHSSKSSCQTNTLFSCWLFNPQNSPNAVEL